MLQVTGKCLGVESENVNGPNGSFISTTIHLLDGVRTEAVRVGRDFPPGDTPKEGETVTLSVSVNAFSFRSGGAGYRLTAERRVHAAPVGARVAAAS
jgi:hypothetical protein